ncbi:4-hydroxyphenylacetate 3-hydroxylase N-terminal domain-containing protein [Jatrophihabitans sp. GAS493]|uniref:4-hydroxyphenylacetate 3-hydroxylase N-terminal domain-containing protein n=1 Tax=Jatrophihabitans sp. GAS493 TaxID=1907575 RepID=UPI0018D54A47|nr:4-hydroxyphenylacetate 3-hydroxylase N-terminal domain-containing protein [Jatrophihabitans sp. GAS493]
MDSLADGRVSYIDGRRIEDLTTDPTTRIAVGLVADCYDTFYSDDPGARNPLLAPPRSAAALREIVGLLRGVDMLAHTTFTSVMTLRTVLPQLQAAHPEYAERVRAHLDYVADNDLRVTECITDAKGHRALSPSKQQDVDAYLRVVERRPDGVVIRGAKLHITGASLAHELFVMPTKKMGPGEEDYAIACAVPANAPGLSTINTTYAFRGEDDRHYPMSRKRQMPDCFVIFDDVFVPNERIFLDGQTEFSALFAHSLGLWERLGGVAEMAHDADLLVGLAELVSEANGLGRVAHVKEKISELVIYATLVRSGLEAAIAHARSTEDGFVYPDELYTNAAKYHGAAEFNTMARNLIDIAGGSVLTAPTIGDLELPELEGHIRQYMTGNPDVSGEDRLRIMHAIRDMVADAFGGWHYVTNVQSGGGLYAQRIVTRKHYPMKESVAMAREAAGLSPKE